MSTQISLEEKRTLVRCKDELMRLASALNSQEFRNPNILAPIHFPPDGSLLSGATIVATQKYQRYQQIVREWVQIKEAYKFNMLMVEDLRDIYLDYQEGKYSEKEFHLRVVNKMAQCMAKNPGVKIH